MTKARSHTYLEEETVGPVAVGRHCCCDSGGRRGGRGGQGADAGVGRGRRGFIGRCLAWGRTDRTGARVYARPWRNNARCGPDVTHPSRDRSWLRPRTWLPRALAQSGARHTGPSPLARAPRVRTQSRGAAHSGSVEDVHLRAPSLALCVLYPRLDHPLPQADMGGHRAP